MQRISYMRAIELFSLDYSTAYGHLFWKISTSNRVKVGSIAGNRTKQNYVRIGIDNQRILAHKIVFLLHNGYWPENGIDHEDQIPYHNHPSNLREATQSCNMHNCGNSKHNTSGVKSVVWVKERNNWSVRLYKNHKLFSAGSHVNLDEAVCYRLALEQCLDYDKCNNNSPAYQYVKNMIQQ